MQHLPLAEKQAMLPIALLAPWLNSIDFDNTVRILNDSIGETWMIVDLDSYFHSSSPLPSREFFKTLCDTSKGHLPWVDFVSRNLFFIPCVQTLDRSDHAIHYQVDAFRELGRGFVFRFELDKNYDFDRAFSFISAAIQDDILCVFDYAYGEPTLVLENKLSSLISKLVSIHEGAKFVISGSNFPNDFSEFDDFEASKPIGSRILFDNLSKQFGNYNMFYGDWASTKPRRYDGGGSRPLPRIDFPTKERWIIARSKTEGWDFNTAAERITRLPEWLGHPEVWGAGMIEKTARGLPGGISTGPEAIACRVNMHLYIQNHYDANSTPPPPRGAWIDPI